MLKLYFAPGACSFVPHFALEAIKAATGEDFEPQMVKLHKGEQRTLEYLAINPNGQVPVLIADGKPLTQIIAICGYLDSRYPQVGLLPADPLARADAMSLFAWMNNTVHPTFTHVFMPEHFADDEAAKKEIQRVGLANFRKYLERIQARVEKAAPFLFGAKPTVLDAYALTLFRWGGLGGIDPAGYPVYRDWVQRTAQQPALAAALARERVPLDMYKKAA
jgi:glutathione S-transferase